MYRKLLKNSAIYGILPQLPKIASFFVLPLITPYLTAADYGVVGVLAAYIGAFSVFHLLGFNIIVVNAFYHHPKQYKWYWRQAYGFLWLWSIVYFSLLGVVIYYTLPQEASANKWLIIAMKVLPAFFFGVSDMLAVNYYRLNHKALPIASRSLFAGLVGIALNYYFIAGLKMGYMGWITSEFITAIVSGILFFIPVYKRWGLTPIFNFKRRLIKKALKVSMPVIPHYYSTYLLNSSDRVIMERVNVPTNEIGRYSLAYNFGIYIETLSNAVNQAVGPNLLELIRNNKWREYQQLIFAFQALILFVCFTLSLWVTQWVPFLIRNKELQNIYLLLIIILMSYSYRPIYIGCTGVIFYYERTSILWRITFIGGVINVIANFIFIPIYGVTAAAVTTFISLLYMGFSGFFFEVVKTYNKAKLKPLMWFLLNIACLFLAIQFYDFGVVEKLIINGIVLLGLGLLQISNGVTDKK